MYLFKAGKSKNQTNIKVNFENLEEDLLMINLDFDVYFEIPSYWRLVDKNGLPPLEIGINSKTKTIQSITVFIDHSCFDDFVLKTSNSEIGNIILNTDIFHKSNDFVDTKGHYTFTITDDKLIVIFNNQQEVSETYINSRVELFLNKEKALCGFAILDLNEQEKEQIKTL